MAYKAALAGLDLGGGKAVIIGDPATLKTEALLRAYGRFVESLHGRYYTACDVGTYSEDMDHVARECSYVTGRTVANGGAGDSSVLTAYGVFQGMRAAAEATWGAPTLAGRTVGIAGVGKVGRHLARHLVEDGASVVVTDVNPAAVAALRGAARGAGGRGHRDAGRRRARRLRALRARRRAQRRGGRHAPRPDRLRGGQQPAGPRRHREGAEDRGVLYAPDYMVNAGGLIQVADELDGFSFDRARQRAEKIFDTTAGLRARPRGGRAAGRGGRPDRRAPDDRGRPAAGRLARLTRPQPGAGRHAGAGSGHRPWVRRPTPPARNVMTRRRLLAAAALTAAGLVLTGCSDGGTSYQSQDDVTPFRYHPPMPAGSGPVAGAVGEMVRSASRRR